MYLTFPSRWPAPSSSVLGRPFVPALTRLSHFLAPGLVGTLSLRPLASRPAACTGGSPHDRFPTAASASPLHPLAAVRRTSSVTSPPPSGKTWAVMSRRHSLLPACDVKCLIHVPFSTTTSSTSRPTPSSVSESESEVPPATWVRNFHVEHVEEPLTRPHGQGTAASTWMRPEGLLRVMLPPQGVAGAGAGATAFEEAVAKALQRLWSESDSPSRPEEEEVGPVQKGQGTEVSGREEPSPQRKAPAAGVVVAMVPSAGFCSAEAAVSYLRDVARVRSRVLCLVGWGGGQFARTPTYSAVRALGCCLHYERDRGGGGGGAGGRQRVMVLDFSPASDPARVAEAILLELSAAVASAPAPARAPTPTSASVPMPTSASAQTPTLTARASTPTVSGGEEVVTSFPDTVTAAGLDNLSPVMSRHMVISGYDAGMTRRVPAILLDEPASYPLDPDPIGPGDVTLATGGAKGATAECVIGLARTTGCSLALVGRSQEDDPEVQKTLGRCREAGVHARYFQADVTDEEEMVAAIEAAEAALGGPVSVVVHGAAKNKSGVCERMGAGEVMEEVVGPKLVGAAVLARVLDRAGWRLGGGRATAALGLERGKGKGTGMRGIVDGKGQGKDGTEGLEHLDELKTAAGVGMAPQSQLSEHAKNGKGGLDNGKAYGKDGTQGLERLDDPKDVAGAGIVPRRPLKLFVGMSSAISTFGMAGSAWYAYANENMEHFCREAIAARRHVFPAYSVWKGVGMGVRMGSVDKLGKGGTAGVSVLEAVNRFVTLCVATPPCDVEVVTSSVGPEFDTWHDGRARAPGVVSHHGSGLRFGSPGRDVTVLRHQPQVELLARVTLYPPMTSRRVQSHLHRSRSDSDVEPVRPPSPSLGLSGPSGPSGTRSLPPRHTDDATTASSSTPHKGGSSLPAMPPRPAQPDIDQFLADHVVGTVPIVPATFALEAMAQACAALLPSPLAAHIVVVRTLDISRPIVAASGQVALYVWALLVEAGSRHQSGSRDQIGSGDLDVLPASHVFRAALSTSPPGSDLESESDRRPNFECEIRLYPPPPPPHSDSERDAAPLPGPPGSDWVTSSLQTGPASLPCSVPLAGSPNVDRPRLSPPIGRGGPRLESDSEPGRLWRPTIPLPSELRRLHPALDVDPTEDLYESGVCFHRGMFRRIENPMAIATHASVTSETESESSPPGRAWVYHVTWEPMAGLGSKLFGPRWPQVALGDACARDAMLQGGLVLTAPAQVLPVRITDLEIRSFKPGRRLVYVRLTKTENGRSWFQIRAWDDEDQVAESMLVECINRKAPPELWASMEDILGDPSESESRRLQELLRRLWKESGTRGEAPLVEVRRSGLACLEAVGPVAEYRTSWDSSSERSSGRSAIDKLSNSGGRSATDAAQSLSNLAGAGEVSDEPSREAGWKHVHRSSFIRSSATCAAVPVRQRSATGPLGAPETGSQSESRTRWTIQVQGLDLGQAKVAEAFTQSERSESVAKAVLEAVHVACEEYVAHVTVNAGRDTAVNVGRLGVQDGDVIKHMQAVIWLVDISRLTAGWNVVVKRLGVTLRVMVVTCRMSRGPPLVVAVVDVNEYRC